MNELGVERTIVRHDPVTARAISRLSHGVAQLSASNSPSTNRGIFRSRRSRHYVKDDASLLKQISYVPNGSKEDNRSAIEHSNKASTGCKRKWQSDKCTGHLSMDIDHFDAKFLSTEPHPANTIANVTILSSVDFSRLGASVLSTDQDKPMRAVHVDARERSSSCSSMLSVTASSDNDSSHHSSHEHEADEEDENEGDVRTISKRNYGRSFGTPDSPAMYTMRLDPDCYAELPLASKFSYGGDSSDGLSVNIKMPRLTMGSTSVSFAAAASRRNCRRDGGTSIRQASQSMLTSAQNVTHRQSRSKSNKSSEGGKKSNRLRCVNSRSHPCSLSRYGSGCKCGSSTSSSSVSSDESPAPGPRPSSSESCEDFANDEQSDFPADESMPHRCRTTALGVSCTRAAKLAIVASDSFGRPKRGSVFRRFTHLSTNPNVMTRGSLVRTEIDPELEDILNVGHPIGTWPLLSQRAKSDYLRGVAMAGKPHFRNPCDLPNRYESASKSCKKEVVFVPSKLTGTGGHRTVSKTRDASPQSVPSYTMSKKFQVPTPSWRKDTDDLENANIFKNVSNPGPSEEPRSFYGLGYSTVNLSTAAPIPETNTGHKLLQRLGWEPGKGLGTGEQGLLDPVGCATFVAKLKR
ncbi:hypothetical protein EG68_04048 [Paragonimus skrjabini miyazakii]|uniref:G-patch domain-containing protein n=1 Tax=Paragonimus skrjabini miyazakii TaxID=59628 RepID=A0A8S9YCW6_9TREM|nr:hypothetical protein EG68_04048 [Paragonimus skrjabini miyazakii]